MIGSPIIEIRRANESDLAAIAHVLVATWQTTFRGLLSDRFLDGVSFKHQYERHSRIMAEQKAAYFVAAHAATNEVVGFANGGPNRHREYPCDGELYAIYVLRECQGRGIGTRLFHALAEQLFQSGLSSMIVWVLENNPNCGFYECMGGRAIAKRATMLDDNTVEEVAYAWSDLGSTLRSHGLQV